MSNFFTNSSGEELAQTTEVEVSTVQRLIPEGTTLEITVLGVEIEPEDNYGNNEYIVISTIVTEKGEYRGIECKHKLHVNDSKDSKADKAKNMLLAYDSNAKGQLFKAASEGKNIIDIGILNRALNGTILSATFALWEMPIKFSNQETRVLEDAFEDDGTPKMRRGNWIKKISPKPSTAAQDAAIERQANDQPNAPVVTPVRQAQPVQVQKPAAQPSAQLEINDSDIPF